MQNSVWGLIGKGLFETAKAIETEKRIETAKAIDKAILDKLCPPKPAKTEKATKTGKVNLQAIFTAVVAENPGITQNRASVETYRRAGRPFTGNHFVNHFSALVKAGRAYFGPVVLDLENGKAKQGLYLK